MLEAERDEAERQASALFESLLEARRELKKVRHPHTGSATRIRAADRIGKKALARSLRDSGKSWPEVALAVDRDIRTVQRWFEDPKRQP